MCLCVRVIWRYKRWVKFCVYFIVRDSCWEKDEFVFVLGFMGYWVGLKVVISIYDNIIGMNICINKMVINVIDRVVCWYGNDNKMRGF